MNILFVITKSSRGGAQQHVRDLAIGCALSGDSVTVAIGETSGWLMEELGAYAVAIAHVRLQRTWNPWTFILYTVDLVRLVRRTHPDVVHFHSSHTLIGTWVLHLFFSRVQSVVTLHGLSLLYQNAASLWKRRLYLVFLTVVLVHADQVICVCEYDRDLLLQFRQIRSDRVSVVYNGVDAPIFLSQMEARARIGLQQDSVVIGTLARFSFQKNIACIIDAFACLNDSAAQLCLIGSGPEESALRQLVQDLHLEDRVVFAEGNATLLKAFSVFVLSSRYEGFPYVLLEAALAEIPIIATRVGGVEELIEDDQTGKLIPSGDVQALADAIKRVVSETELFCRYAKNARERVESAFTKKRMMQEIDRVYRAIILR